MGDSLSPIMLKSKAYTLRHSYILRHSTTLNLKIKHKGFSVDGALQPRLPESAKVPLMLTGFSKINWL